MDQRTRTSRELLISEDKFTTSLDFEHVFGLMTHNLECHEEKIRCMTIGSVYICRVYFLITLWY